jgi:hypothetical protein
MDTLQQVKKQEWIRFHEEMGLLKCEKSALNQQRKKQDKQMKFCLLSKETAPRI